SPGILASIVKNEHYPSFDAYIDAIAAALRTEYETIVGSGFYLQIDAPDLALERHVAFSKRPLKDFQQFVDRVIAAINTALVNIPRKAPCLLGQLRGTARSRRAARRYAADLV